MLLYLSGFNKMEGLLKKNNWLRFPPKPKEAKLNFIQKVGWPWHIGISFNSGSEGQQFGSWLGRKDLSFSLKV